jgi:hypothetical protein
MLQVDDSPSRCPGSAVPPGVEQAQPRRLAADGAGTPMPTPCLHMRACTFRLPERITVVASGKLSRS